MSCITTCQIQSSPMVVTLLTGPPGAQGPAGPQGPQGPPGSATSIGGDLLLTQGQTQTEATVIGLRTKPISSTAPTANQIFQFNGTQWVPVDFTAGTY